MLADADAAAWPFDANADLKPMMDGMDGLFYLLPRVGVHHAEASAREALTKSRRRVQPLYGEVRT